MHFASRGKWIEMAFLENFIASFIVLFFIMDPFASIPLFVSLTKGLKEAERSKAADSAVLVAAILALAFLFFGTAILSAFRVSLASFKIFGGIVLALLALETILGLGTGGAKKKPDVHVATVIIATPMLTGPGVITTEIILASQFGVAPVLAATLAVSGVSWLVLRGSSYVKKAVGDNALDVAIKVIGLLLGAVGVEFIRSGLAV